MRPLLRALVVALAAGAITVLALPPQALDATESPTATDLGMDVTAGFGGQVVNGAWVPVTVVLAPRHLFAGRLEVAAQLSSGTQMVEARDVEVAAGSQKLYRFVLPPSQGLTVRAAGDGDDPVVARVDARRVGASTFLAGVLGEVPDQLPAVEATASRERAEFVAVDPSWLEVSSRALDPLGTLVAPIAEIEGLAEDAATNLRQAVLRGMDLTVTVDRPGPVDLSVLGIDDLPATDGATVAGSGLIELTPAADVWSATVAQLATVDDAGGGTVAASSLLGRGRIAVVGIGLGEGALGQEPGLWAHLVQPGGQIRDDAGQPMARLVGSSQEVLAGSDLAVPTLPWLAAFLLSYVLVVGPLNAIVLGRVGRRELAWLTVPAITVVFGAGAFLASSTAAPPTGVSARARYWVDGAGTEVAVAAVRAPTPGRHDVTLPDRGWDLTANSFRSPAQVDRDGGDVEVSFDLEALEIATVVGWHPVHEPPPLEVSATSGAEGVELVIRNVGDRPLEDVVVHAASASRSVRPALGPGEERTIEAIGSDTLPQAEPWMDDFEGVRGPDGRPELPGSLRALLRWDVLDRAPGLVWVSATLPNDGSALTADGRTTDDYGTLVAVAARPTPDGQLTPFSVTRQVTSVTSLGGGDSGFWPSTTAIESVESIVLRYRLPGGARPVRLTSSLHLGWNDGGFVEPPPPPLVECDVNGVCTDVGAPQRQPPPDIQQGGAGIEVWDVQQGAWLALADAFRDGAGDPARLVGPLGEVHVRATANGLLDFSARGLGAELEVAQ